MQRIFVYGFGPFEEFTTNISEAVIAELAVDPRLLCHVFAVRFDRQMFEIEFNRHKPQLIIGLGQCRSGDTLRWECLAVNAMRHERHGAATPIETNCGDTFLNVSLTAPQHPFCAPSNDAGSYVCNFSMWVAEQWARANEAKYGFIHIPLTLEVPPVVNAIREIIAGWE
jgi:pyrrolidone-carboxylate peptidase